MYTATLRTARLTLLAAVVAMPALLAGCSGPRMFEDVTLASGLGDHVGMTHGVG